MTLNSASSLHSQELLEIVLKFLCRSVVSLSTELFGEVHLNCKLSLTFSCALSVFTEHVRQCWECVFTMFLLMLQRLT